MKTMTKDARGFVQGVVEYLRKEGKDSHNVPKVQSLLYKVTETAKRQKQAVVESPVKLTSQEEQALSRVLSRVMGHEVAIECLVNPALIAGVRIQMADWVVDTSFHNQLTEMSKILTEGSQV
jgi:F-type H+-transporting ATPase subunit delta